MVKNLGTLSHSLTLEARSPPRPIQCLCQASLTTYTIAANIGQGRGGRRPMSSAVTILTGKGEGVQKAELTRIASI